MRHRYEVPSHSKVAAQLAGEIACHYGGNEVEFDAAIASGATALSIAWGTDYDSMEPYLRGLAEAEVSRVDFEVRQTQDQLKLIRWEEGIK